MNEELPAELQLELRDLEEAQFALDRHLNLEDVSFRGRYRLLKAAFKYMKQYKRTQRRLTRFYSGYDF